MKKRKAAGLTAVLLLASALLGACGTGSPDPGTPAGGGSSASETEETHAAADPAYIDFLKERGYVDDTTKILGDRFAGQHYGGAVTPEHADLISYVNAAIEEL